jgi:hypothetical protein
MSPQDTDISAPAARNVTAFDPLAGTPADADSGIELDHRLSRCDPYAPRPACRMAERRFTCRSATARALTFIAGPHGNGQDRLPSFQGTRASRSLLACWPQFRHARPPVGWDIGMDDLGWLGKKAWHLGDCHLEVAGTDVGFTGRHVPERLHQKVHSRVVGAA